MKYSKYSAVIVGSGAAGLYLALKLAQEKHTTDGILVITKETLEDCATKLAQGGIVAVIPEINKKDSTSSHISDTIKAGCGLNDFNTVNHISQCSSYAIQDLIDFGVEFDKTQDGNLSFTLEAAHSVPRILHVKDKTGEAIEKALVKKIRKCPDIDVYENTMAVELLCDSENIARGLITYNKQTGIYEAIYSNATILATGGIGQIYKYTTNPKVATGDGIALAHRAGAKLENMEFVQFHPSALAVNSKENLPLVSEAVRGAGAKLCDDNGNYFAKDFDPNGELAPRDVVARGIFAQMNKENKKNVFLDISQMGIEFFRNRFPNITSLCEQNNIDISEGLIPITPAVHYFMGGIKTNVCGETTIKNLYAIGETACNGLHGANRLASNSLLECIVGGWELNNLLCEKRLDAPKNYDEKIKKILEKYSQEPNYQHEPDEINIEEIKNKIKTLMWENVGIVRNEENLSKAKYELDEIFKLIEKCDSSSVAEFYELKNMALVANLITQSALNRKNSIGAHFRSDFPNIETIKTTDNKEEEKENGEIFAE